MKMSRSMLPLTLLTVLVSTQLCGCLLAAAGAGAEAGYVASQDDRTTSETLSDQVIVSSVKTKLLADSEVPGMEINVDSFKGNVTLRGALKSERAISRAIELAEKTDGVKSVTSKLVYVS